MNSMSCSLKGLMVMSDAAEMNVVFLLSYIHGACCINSGSSEVIKCYTRQYFSFFLSVFLFFLNITLLIVMLLKNLITEIS